MVKRKKLLIFMVSYTNDNFIRWIIFRFDVSLILLISGILAKLLTRVIFLCCRCVQTFTNQVFGRLQTKIVSNGVFLMRSLDDFFLIQTSHTMQTKPPAYIRMRKKSIVANDIRIFYT